MQGTQGTYRNSRGDITNGNAMGGGRLVTSASRRTCRQQMGRWMRRPRRLNSTAR